MANKIVLGINDGYASCVSALVDGVPKFNVQEERFNKIKNYGGFPKEGIQWLSEIEKINFSDVESIGMPWVGTPFKSTDSFKNSKHKLFDTLLRVLPHSFVGSDFLINNVVKLQSKKRLELKEVSNLLAESQLSENLVQLYPHHECHAAASLYGSGFLKKHDDVLVITLDGSGDGESMTVWQASPNGMKKLASQNSYHSIGIFVARLTQYMGMKPLEHEYKIMGMAPYGNGYSSQKVLDIFEKYFCLDSEGLKIINHMNAWGEGMVRRLHKDLYQVRFDSICWAIQELFEKVCSSLVLNWVKKTNIKQVVVGGGNFMNVKLNMKLAQHDMIDDFYVLPSCGDESLALGASYLAQEKYQRGTSEPLNSLYQGPKITKEEIVESIAKHKDKIEYRISDNINIETAEMLAQDKILGRCSGRAEWGARALGNRSIICNPNKPQNIHRINQAVKKRDFWMPFCPSILDTDADKYLLNRKKREAPHMILAFESKEVANDDLPCGLHPFDATARPQIVNTEKNPDYYELLTHFKKLTNIGAIVNTSFNLHGLPIVNSADDAIHVLLNSKLDFVTIENYILWRK